MENGYHFRIHVLLNGITPDKVLVELFADGINGTMPVIIKMEPDAISENPGEYIYHARFTSARPPSDYTARIIPNYEDVSVPLEDNLILWQTNSWNVYHSFHSG